MLKITYAGCAGKSKVPSMKKARSHWFGKSSSRNGCIKPYVPVEHLKQGLSTSGAVQLLHGSTFGICQQSTIKYKITVNGVVGIILLVIY